MAQRSTTAAIADAIVDAWNAENPGRPRATRERLPIFDLANLDEAQPNLRVVPRGRQYDLADRDGTSETIHRIDVLTITKIRPGTEQDTDDADALAERLEDWLIGKEVAGLSCVRITPNTDGGDTINHPTLRTNNLAVTSFAAFFL